MCLMLWKIKHGWGLKKVQVSLTIAVDIALDMNPIKKAHNSML